MRPVATVNPVQMVVAVQTLHHQAAVMTVHFKTVEPVEPVAPLHGVQTVEPVVAVDSRKKVMPVPEEQEAQVLVA